MALPTLNTTDFVGPLVVNWQLQRFEEYISEFYPIIVEECIGENAFAEVLESNPLADKWQDLFDGGVYTDSEGKKKYFKGLTYAVKYFVFSKFIADNFVPTNEGIKQNESENSRRLSNIGNARLMQQRYNVGVLTMVELCKFVDNFANFEQPITGFSDDGGGLFTINTSSTKYLADGDKVTIAGVEYEAMNVVIDVSFQITSTSASSFDGVYISNPYEDVIIGRTEALI